MSFDYHKFKDTLSEKGMTQYKLIHKYHVSNHILQKLRDNKPLQIDTLDRLCQILDCDLSEIVTITRDKEE